MPAKMIEDIAPVGPNQINEDPELALFAKRVRRSRHGDRDRKTNSGRNWDTYFGRVWPKETKEKIERKDRTPATSINLVLPTVNATVGEQIVNRREAQFKPVDLSQHDAVVANWMTRLVRHFWGRARGHRSEARSILEQRVSGVGWYHIFVNLETAPLSIALEWVPDGEMSRDTDSREDNGADAQFVLRRTLHDLKDAQVRWPQHKLLFESAASSGEPYPSRHETNEELGQHGMASTGPGKQDQVEVWEYQYRRSEPYIAYYPEEIQTDPQTGQPATDPQTGQPIKVQAEEMQRLPKKEFYEIFTTDLMIQYRDLTDGSEGEAVFEEFAAMSEKAPSRFREVGRTEPTMPEEWYEYGHPVYYTGKILRGATGADKWIEGPSPTGLSAFTYILVNGYWMYNTKEARVEYFGLVDTIYETQLLIAKVMTQTVQMLTRAAKQGGILNKGVVATPENFQDNMGVAGMIHLANKPLDTGDWTPFGSPTFPPFHGELLNRLLDAIPAQSSVTDYLTGTEQRERSEVLVSNLQNRAKTTLAGLFDPVESARMIAGRLIMEMIQSAIPDKVIMRILGEDAEAEGVTFEYQPDPETGRPAVDPQTGEKIQVPIATAAELLKRRSMADFDVVVDTGEASVNEKQAILSVMGQLMKHTETMPLEMQEMLHLILLRSMPLPKGQASEKADEYEQLMEDRRKAQTVDGILEMFQTMELEALQEVVAEGEAILEQAMPEEEAPPEGAPEEAQQPM